MLSLRSTKTIRHCVLVGVSAALCVLLLVLRHGQALLYREFYLHLIGAKSEAELQLSREFSSFNELRSDVMYASHAPRTRQQLLDTFGLMLDPDARKKYPHIITGIDPWGRELIFEIIVKSTETEEEQQIVIRSIGVNGRDENGHGDDLQVRITNMWIPPIVCPTGPNTEL